MWTSANLRFSSVEELPFDIVANTVSVGVEVVDTRVPEIIQRNVVSTKQKYKLFFSCLVKISSQCYLRTSSLHKTTIFVNSYMYMSVCT